MTSKGHKTDTSTCLSTRAFNLFSNAHVLFLYHIFLDISQSYSQPNLVASSIPKPSAVWPRANMIELNIKQRTCTHSLRK